MQVQIQKVGSNGSHVGINITALTSPKSYPIDSNIT
jgi:hypothetical protein